MARRHIVASDGDPDFPDRVRVSRQHEVDTVTTTSDAPPTFDPIATPPPDLLERLGA